MRSLRAGLPALLPALLPAWLMALLLGVGCMPAAAAIDRAAFIRLAASVVRIEVLRVQGGYALGSGVVVASDKVVTNCHVTREGREIRVLVRGLRRVVESQASDPEHDLCVLRVADLQATPVALGSADGLRIGESMNALGYTGGLELQHSEGAVVALHRHDGGRVIQSSNFFSSGASGGGLFDDERRLVGILTFRLRGGEAHYFAAPVEWLRPLLADDAAYADVAPALPAQAAYWERPADAQPNFLKAAVLQRERRWPELESLAGDWTRSDADDPEPWFLRGLALDALSRLPEAQRALERSLQLEPAFVDAWFRLGLVYLRQGMKSLAREALGRLDSLRSQLAPELRNAIEAR